MRHDWVLFLISRFVVPLYAQDNTYNHNAKCSLLKDTSNQWISTRSKFPAEIYLAHIMSTFPASVENTAHQCFAIWNFPKYTDPTKTACINLLLQEQNQLGEWPLLSQGVYTSMFICCFLHSQHALIHYDQGHSPLFILHYRAVATKPLPSIQIRTDAQWPDYHGQNNCGEKPNCLSLLKYLNCNGQIGHWPSLDTIKHRGPASEP